MINFIKGQLYETTNNSVIIDCMGVGYEIFCPLGDIVQLSSKKGEEVVVFTYMSHREDSMTLFGFLKQKTKDGFKALLKVGGIGPKAALKILSHYDVEALFKSVEDGDIDSLKDIPGIGPKMAKKIIFDLKGILPAVEGGAVSILSAIEKDLLSAMMNLGYKENDVKSKIKEIKPISDNFEVEFKKIIKKMAGK